jgi:hypothetical protein
MGEESGWEHLLRALKELWAALVEKGYAGWIIWAANKVFPDLDLTYPET